MSARRTHARIVEEAPPARSAARSVRVTAHAPGAARPPGDFLGVMILLLNLLAMPLNVAFNPAVSMK